MPTAHYIPLSLNENGLHPTHLNRTTETALRLDVEVPRSDSLASSDNGIPRTKDVTMNVSTPHTESHTNSDSTVNNGQKKKRNSRVSFNDRLEDLKAYKEKNGHLNVKEKDDDKSIYRWCRNIRSARRKPGKGTMKLTQERIAALDAIGFDWRSETTHTREKGISFIDRVEALRHYKEKTGHLNVTIEDNKSLYFWCTHIRCARRGTGTMKLTADGIASLDAIGFDWRSETKTRYEQRHISFIDRVKALRQYKEKHGHLNVTFKANNSLYDWCGNVRNAKKGKLQLTLTADRIAALDAIGFDWKSEAARTRSDRFQDRVDALIEYKEKHGHLCVSKKDDKSLNSWCKNIRNARRNPESCKRKVTADQIAALDAIGFDWRLPKSVLQPFDSLGDDADKAFGKSGENNNIV